MIFDDFQPKQPPRKLTTSSGTPKKFLIEITDEQTAEAFQEYCNLKGVSGTQVLIQFIKAITEKI
jgi:hypothetical protein